MVVKRQVVKKFFDCESKKISRDEFLILAIPFVEEIVDDLISKKLIAKNEKEDACQTGLLILIDWLNGASHPNESQMSFFVWRFMKDLENTYQPCLENHDNIYENNIISLDSIDDVVINNQLLENMEEVLLTLTERERKVLRMRFGLDDGVPKTLLQVGTEFFITMDRVRQIEAKALRKLRHPFISKKIKDFLY